MKTTKTKFECVSRKKFTAPLRVVVLSLVSLAGINSASAVTLISDTFTAAELTAVTAHSPDVNVLGSGYVTAGTGDVNGVIRLFSSGNGQAAPDGNYVQFGGHAAAGISLTNVPSPSYTLSADLNPFNSNDVTGQLNPLYGMGVGFFSATPANLNANFSGLALTNGGSAPSPTLSLLVNGTVIQSFSTNYVRNSFSFINLNYTVDTTTGDILGLVTLGSQTFDFNPTTAFLMANNAYVGIGSDTVQGSVTTGSGAYYNSGFIDNFTVTAPVPEPSTYALLLGGGLALISLRKRSKKATA